MLLDVLRVRWRFRRGLYHAKPEAGDAGPGLGVAGFVLAVRSFVARRIAIAP